MTSFHLISLLSSFPSMIWCWIDSLSVYQKIEPFLLISFSLLFLLPPLTNELQGDHDQVLSAIVWNNSLFCEVKVRHWQMCLYIFAQPCISNLSNAPLM